MAKKNLPVVAAPDGALLVHAGKYARTAVLTAFEMIGGTKRLADWADENPGEFFTKVFTKTITKEIEGPSKDSIEDLLDAVDAEFSEVDEKAVDADFEDA